MTGKARVLPSRREAPASLNSHQTLKPERRGSAADKCSQNVTPDRLVVRRGSLMSQRMASANSAMPLTKTMASQLSPSPGNTATTAATTAASSSASL